MKDFTREHTEFSLCGLNCLLCPMQVGGYCPGCGGGPGNQSCTIAWCSMDKGGYAFCSQCPTYPCARYDEFDAADSFVPHSRRACLSATAFKSGFRRLYSLPVHTWLRQRRMEKAAELLRGSSLSVLEVAMAVGYGSASQFTAAFRLQYGVTPAAYRKNV